MAGGWRGPWLLARSSAAGAVFAWLLARLFLQNKPMGSQISSITIIFVCIRGRLVVVIVFKMYGVYTVFTVIISVYFRSTQLWAMINLLFLVILDEFWICYLMIS